MPARFSIKALLVVTAVVALWMTTHLIPDPLGIAPGGKIRSAMMLTILLMSGFGVLYLRGKRQAFFAGFFVTMGLFWIQFKDYVPNLSDVAISLASYAPGSMAAKALLESSIWLLLVVGFSSIVGIAAAYFYGLRQRDDDANSRAKSDKSNS